MVLLHEELKQLLNIVEMNNFSEAKVEQIGVFLDREGTLTVEAFFNVTKLGYTEMVRSVSEIEGKYLTQFSEEKILKQIIGDLLFNLESHQLEDSTKH